MAHKRVFISYSRQDRDFVHNLKARLESNDIACWLDTDEMAGGAKWQAQISAALQDADFLLLVLSPHALQSAPVEWEWKQARQMGVCVQPLVADGYTVRELLPDLKRWMRDRHIHSIGDDNWETLLGQLQGPCAVDPVPPPNAPALPNNYVQRDDVFLPLRELLLQNARQTLVSMTTSLQGGGGFGKTVLASAICYDDDIRDTYDDGVYWITVGQQPDLHGLIADVCMAFTGQRPTITSDDAARDALTRALSEKDVLLVLDDVWREDHLQLLLHGGDRCVRLITTRSADVAFYADGEPLDVQAMNNADAVRVLAAALKNPPTDDAPLKQLAARLGEWPLLLNLAAGIIRKEERRARSAEKALLYLQAKLETAGVNFLHNNSLAERDRSAGATIEVSLEMLDDLELRAAFYQMGIFAEDSDIPFSSLAALWGFAADDAVRTFDDLSLLTRLDLDAETVRLHDVVREYCASRLDDIIATHRQLLDGWGDPTTLPDAYAWHNYSYHAVAANRADELAKHLLQPTYLLAKLNATHPAALLLDFERLPREALRWETAEALTHLERLIGMDAHQLEVHPNALPSGILGRMSHYDQPEVDHLLLQTRQSIDIPYLDPIRATLRPMGTLRRTIGLSSSVRAVCVHQLNPDESRLFVGKTDGTIAVFDATTYQALGELTGHRDKVNALAVHPRGWLISASNDNDVRLWDIATMTSIGVLAGHTDWVEAVAVHPNGDIITASQDHTARVWNADTLSTRLVLAGHNAPVHKVAAHPNGTIITAGDDHMLRVWDIDTGATIAVLAGHTSKVRGVIVHPNGTIISSGYNSIRLWDAATYTIQRIISNAHTDWVRGLAITDDGYLVSCSHDKSVRVWNLDEDEPAVADLYGHTDWVRALAIHPDGTVISGGSDRTVRIWEPLAEQPVHTVPPIHRGPVTGLAFGTLDVVSVNFAHNATVSVSADRSVQLWDNSFASVQVKRFGSMHFSRIGNHESIANDVVVHPDGRIISAGNDNALRVWQPLKRKLSFGLLDNIQRRFQSNARELATLTGHSRGVNAVALLPNGHIISASNDKTLRVWDADTYQTIAVLTGHDKAVNGIAVHPSGVIVSASGDGTLRLWDGDTFEPIAVLAGHDGKINRVRLHPDGLIISASNDATVRLWDIDQRACVAVLQGHRGYVNDAAAHPHGYLVSAGGDAILLVWNVATAQPIAAFYADGELWSVAVRPDGLIVAGDGTGAVHFLRLVNA